MTTRRTGSYSYNAVCDVCGAVFKSSELQARWDGYMVCKDDWEPRNILDFFKPRNDNHKLPWTRPDYEIETTWTPTFVNVTQTVGTGTITTTGTYITDTINSIITIWAQITITGNATTAAAAGTITLPVTSVAAGSVRVFDGQGIFIGTAVVPSLSATANLPNWSTKNTNIIISGKYGT